MGERNPFFHGPFQLGYSATSSPQLLIEVLFIYVILILFKKSKSHFKTLQILHDLSNFWLEAFHWREIKACNNLEKPSHVKFYQNLKNYFAAFPTYLCIWKHKHHFVFETQKKNHKAHTHAHTFISKPNQIWLGLSCIKINCTHYSLKHNLSFGTPCHK